MFTARFSMSFLKNFMDREESLLLRLNAGNLIGIDKEDKEKGPCDCSSQSVSEDYDEKLVSDIHNKKTMVSLFTLGKLSKIF